MNKFLFFIILLFVLPAKASIKDKIVDKFNQTKNLKFNFIQTINGKDQKGNCVIEFPKKIFCQYDSIHKKILVSNGNSLVIKINKKNQYYRYPLDKTPLNILLNKQYLINKINKIEGSLIDEKYYLFSIIENNNKLNIFFEKENLKLTGWQTEDIYQNLSVTFIYNVIENIYIDQKIFLLPKNNF
tara:strand:- start:73 stop:627 length:555 start_codon:yes stop_codon:yes gene_type:complete